MSGLPLCRSTSVCLSFRSVGRIVCPSALLVCLFVYLSVVVRLSLLSAGLSVCLFVCLSVCLSFCLYVGLSVYSVCRSVRSVGLSVAAFVGIELHLCAQIGRRGYGRRHASAGPVILACFEFIKVSQVYEIFQVLVGFSSGQYLCPVIPLSE